MKINGADPDFHRRDLWNVDSDREHSLSGSSACRYSTTTSPTSSTSTSSMPTKLIPEEILPIRRIGRLVLDRVVDNFFAETEQVAFCTNNIVPGIDFTNDPLLQGRNFSYLDTQLKRLGSPNFTHLPINAPKCPFATFQQDGHMAMDNPGRARQLRAELVDRRRRRASRGSGDRVPVVRRASRAAKRARARRELFADHYSQARQFYASQTPTEQTAHRQLVRVRALEGRASSTSASEWWPTFATSTTTWRQRSATGSAWRAARCVGPRARADHRSRAVAGVEHLRNPPATLRGPQARASWSATARMPGCSTR